MKQQIIIDVMQQMLPHLDNAQMQKLQKVLEYTLHGCEITVLEENDNDNSQLVESFISAKRIEGCSEKTLKYYRTTIETMLISVDKSIRYIQTEDLRSYLINYQNEKQSSRVTIDNIRRILSSFFSWLEDEDYILKSPVRRIHKVKTATNIKETYTDEDLEKMRDNCTELRDLAMIDMLASTGMRIGELLALTYNDINLEEKTISINKSYQRLKGKDMITQPKTPKSIRVITMPDFLAEEFREYCSHLYGIMKKERLFRFTKSHMEHCMATGIERSGVKRIRLHDLRHSHARNRKVFLPTGIKRWTESKKYGKICIRNDIVKSRFVRNKKDKEMRVQQLKYILKVAEVGSITEAAKLLFISQPSMSNSIKETEKEAGITIFLRSRTGITLTKDGAEFLGYARQVIQQMELLEDRYVTNLPGKVTFGVSSQHYTFTENAFVELVKRFGQERYAFYYNETGTHQILDDVKNRVCDLGILYLSHENEVIMRKVIEENHLVFTELFSAKPHVFLQKDHPLASKKVVFIHDLAPYPRLNFVQGEYESVYFSEELFSSIPVDKEIRVNDRGAIVNFMLGLNAYTISSGIFPKYLNGENIISVPLAENETMHIGYVLNENQELSELGKSYLEELRKYAPANP